MYEQDGEYTLAIKFYTEAADLFYAEHDYSSEYNNTKLKVAELSINLPDVNIVEIIKVTDRQFSARRSRCASCRSPLKPTFGSFLLLLLQASDCNHFVHLVIFNTITDPPNYRYMSKSAKNISKISSRNQAPKHCSSKPACCTS